MTKENIITDVAAGFEIPVNQSAKIVNRVFELITAELMEGNSVKIHNFGTFTTTTTKRTKCYNFKTKQREECKPHTVVRFKPSNILKECIAVAEESKCEGDDAL